MNRARLMLGALVALAGCGGSETGIDVVLRMGQLEYDELRLGVTDANGTLVDPDGKGHFVAPFPAGDQSVIIYLSDALDGTAVQCSAEARLAGSAVASGSAGVTIRRRALERVEIVMAGASGGAGGGSVGGAGGPGDSGPGGSGSGSTGTGGSGPGGGGTGGSNTGAGGGNASPRANGDACSVAGECVSGHCSDGVCCEEECQKACRSCALPDTKGLCRPVAAGTPDPRAMCNDKGAASCQTNGLCDVAGDCAVYPAGTVCGAASCADMDTAAVPARTCDGAGRCQGDPKKMKCPMASVCVAGVCS
jgi:hypothetical protein